MTPRVVYDTNVVVSALLKENSDPALLVRLVLNESVIPCLSRFVFDEYQEVLKRPKFSFDPNLVDQFLCDFCKRALMVAPKRRVHAALDEADNRFLECARSARAKYLVTGNRKHFPFTVFGKTQIVSPAELIGILTERPH
jgi:putative PIN family toxin of toxin-antitoxin system